MPIKPNCRSIISFNCPNISHSPTALVLPIYALLQVKFEDSKCPRMLNFNVPLLSTRRLANSGRVDLQGASLSTSDRIPFSWEQVPGKPKDSNTSDDVHDGDTPRPKLPPGWWRWTHDLDDGSEGNDDFDDDVGDVDGDIDDADYSNDDFSDAIDVFSLPEAIDIVEKKAQRGHETTDSLKLKLAEDSREMNQKCSNFIIERFLPDATALAASSALQLNVSRISSSNELCYPWNYPEPEACVSRTVCRQSYSSPKGCGLHVFFPWRMKHKLCGVKSPVSAQAHCSVKHKKHIS